MTKYHKKSKNKLFYGGNRFKVLKRDKYRCQKCGITNKEHIKIYNRDITIHHIDGNKKNNSLDNLITLCLSCHGKEDIKKHKRQLKVDENLNELLNSLDS